MARAVSACDAKAVLRAPPLHEEQKAEVVEEFWVVIRVIPLVPILPHLTVHLLRAPTNLRLGVGLALVL
eukprot:11076848-Lingulodinium_polyedra.AAC.1